MACYNGLSPIRFQVIIQKNPSRPTQSPQKIIMYTGIDDYVYMQDNYVYMYT